MNWTKERPTKPGLYVVRTESASSIPIYPMPSTINVFLSAGKLIGRSNYQSLSYSIENDFFNNLEWLGPLPE